MFICSGRALRAVEFSGPQTYNPRSVKCQNVLGRSRDGALPFPLPWRTCVMDERSHMDSLRHVHVQRPTQRWTSLLGLSATPNGVERFSCHQTHGVPFFERFYVNNSIKWPRFACGRGLPRRQALEMGIFQNKILAWPTFVFDRR